MQGFPLDMLLYADDLESLGGFQVDWLGMETDSPGHQLGLSKKRASWLVDWLEDKSTLGKVRSSPRDWAVSASLPRPWIGKDPFQDRYTPGRLQSVGVLTVPTMLRVLCHWFAERLAEGGRLQTPAPLVDRWAALRNQVSPDPLQM